MTKEKEPREHGRWWSVCVWHCLCNKRGTRAARPRCLACIAQSLLTVCRDEAVRQVGTGSARVVLRKGARRRIPESVASTRGKSEAHPRQLFGAPNRLAMAPGAAFCLCWLVAVGRWMRRVACGCAHRASRRRSARARSEPGLSPPLRVPGAQLPHCASLRNSQRRRAMCARRRGRAACASRFGHEPCLAYLRDLLSSTTLASREAGKVGGCRDSTRFASHRPTPACCCCDADRAGRWQQRQRQG